MKWEAPGAIAETLSAVGVIVTLLYLAFQIRHGVGQAKAQGVALLGVRMHDLTQELRQDPDLYALLLRASQDWDSLSEEERSIVHLWNVDEASLYETARILWREAGASYCPSSSTRCFIRRRPSCPRHKE